MSIFDLNSELKTTDSEIAALINEEFKRQSENIELIASDNTLLYELWIFYFNNTMH